MLVEHNSNYQLIQIESYRIRLVPRNKSKQIHLAQLHGKIHPLHTCFLFQSKKALKPKVERLCTSLLTTVLLVRLSKAKPSMHAEITLD